MEPTIAAALGVESNPLLEAGVHDSSPATLVVPAMRIRGRSELSEADINLVLNFKNYSDDRVEDTDQQILSFTSGSRTSERNRVGLNGEFRRDDLRESVTGTGAGNINDTDVGLIQTTVKRDWRNLRPFWTRDLTERQSLQLSYDYTDVSFSNAAGTGLVDYVDQNLALTWSYSVNPRDAVSMTADASRYRAATIDNSSDTQRLLVGFSRAFSETGRGSVAAGISRTKQDFAGSSDDSNGFVFEGTARESSEVTQLDGTISHDVSPSGIGQTIQSDQLRMRLVRALAPRAELVLRATLLRNRVIKGSNPDVDRRYYEIEPGLAFQWTREWSFVTSYTYRYQKFDVDPTSASSNAVYVGLAYNLRAQLLGR